VDSWFGVLLASWMFVGFIWLCAQLIEGNWRTFQSAANEVWRNATEALEAKVLAANENGIWVEVWNRGSRGTVVKGFLVRNGSEVALVPVENAVYSQEGPDVPSYNPSTGEVMWRKTNPNYLLVNERKVFVLRPQSYTYIAVKGDTHKFYPIRDLEPFLITVLGVDALDSETSQPVPFSYSLTLSSKPIHLEGRAEEGRFRLRVSDEDHAYLVRLSSPGYENLTLTGGLKAGETKILQALMRYDPFDLELSESSVSLSRNTGESWPAKDITLTLTPKNGYTGGAVLTVESKLDYTLSSSSLSFHSPASATLTVSPKASASDGSYEIKVFALDSSGRRVENAVIAVTLSTSSGGGGGGGGSSGGGGPIGSQIWTIVYKHDTTTVCYSSPYGYYEYTSNGVPNAQVSWSLQFYDGSTGVNGTASNGFIRWTWDEEAFPTWQTARCTVSAPGYHWYDDQMQPHDTVVRDVYVDSSSIWATAYLTNIGRITGMSASPYTTLVFYKVGEERSTTLTVYGDYTLPINTAYDEYDIEGVYHVWTTPTQLSSPGSYTFKAKCLKWQPPTGIVFHPYAGGIAPIARWWGTGLGPTGASVDITLEQEPQPSSH